MSDVRLRAPATRLHERSQTRSRVSSLPPPLSRFAREADVTDDHLDALCLWVGLGLLASAAMWWFVGPSHGAVMVAVVGAAPVVVGRRWAGRRRRRLLVELPDVVDLIGRSLRSGASLTQALNEAAADGPRTAGSELRIVSDGLGRGQTASDAALAWARRTPQAEVRIVAASLALASRNERGTTQALEGVSQSLRDRSALRAEIRSHSAQAAASMQALVLVPVFFLGLDLMGGQQTITFLTHEPVGQLCLVAAVVLDLAGWWWMALIIRRRASL